MTTDRVKKELDKLLQEHPDFTGKVEVNFKSGRPKDLNVTLRTFLCDPDWKLKH